MLDDERLRNIVDARDELDHEVATAAAAGTSGKIVEGVLHREPVDDAQIGAHGESAVLCAWDESGGHAVPKGTRQSGIRLPFLGFNPKGHRRPERIHHGPATLRPACQLMPSEDVVTIRFLLPLFAT